MATWRCLTHAIDWSESLQPKPTFCPRSSAQESIGQRLLGSRLGSICNVVLVNKGRSPHRDASYAGRPGPRTRGPELQTWQCLDHDPPYVWQQVTPPGMVPDVCPSQSPEELMMGAYEVKPHRIVEVK